MVNPLQSLALRQFSMRVGDVEHRRVEPPNCKGQGNKHNVYRPDEYGERLHLHAERRIIPNIIILQILHERRFVDEEIAVQVEVVGIVLAFKGRAV